MRKPEGTAILGESEPVDEAAIKAAVKSRDYEFVSLEGENCFLKELESLCRE